MKIAVAKEHRDYFKKNGWIEFENLFNTAQLSRMNDAIDLTLAERLSISVGKLSNALPESLYMQGHDLWRDNPDLRQLISLPRLGEIISDLIELKPLRLGYDQILYTVNESRITGSSCYAGFLKESSALQGLSSIKGLVAGLLICLNEPCQEDKSDSDILPQHAGNILIFNPEKLLDFSALINNSSQRFYLVTYAQSSSYYLHEPNDSHRHTLKKYGYSFNDKLNDKQNPIVYR